VITSPTVFVLGAGASIPYGFPSGEKLAESIAHQLMNGNGPPSDRAASEWSGP